MQYIIDKTGGTVHVGNAKEVKAEFSKLPEDQRLQGGAFIIKSAEDLKALSLAALATLYNSVVEDDDQVKKFGKKDDKTVQKVWDAAELNYDPKVQAQAEKAAAAAEKAAAREVVKDKPAAKGAKKDAGAPSTGAPREGSKMGNLVTHLQLGGESTLEELSEASGYDLNNTRTAIGILRSKKGMAIAYNRETKLYQLGE